MNGIHAGASWNQTAKFGDRVFNSDKRKALAAELLVVSAQCLRDCNVRSMACMLRGMVRLRVYPGPDLLSDVQSHLTTLVYDENVPLGELQSPLSSLVSLGADPQSELLRALRSAADQALIPSALLTSQIGRAKTSADVLAMIWLHEDNMNGIHLAACWSRLVRLDRLESLSLKPLLDATNYRLKTISATVQPRTVAAEFNEREVSVVLHAVAKLGVKPERTVLRALESRAESIADDLNPQNVANTMWAFATLGRVPGDGLLRALESRAESIADDFDPQNVANTMSNPPVHNQYKSGNPQ
jgi:hypothetical protein